MGIYADYLDSLGSDFSKITAERKKQLQRIADLRGRDVLVYAVDAQKGKSPININYTDLLPISDQLTSLKRADLDLIIETPGGSGEAAEDIVELLRGRFANIGVVIPGMAKSAGTLIAMAADEILMEPMSALGPIDAQITWQGKVFSAHALLEGMDKIKGEVAATGTLNKAYVPILQNVSPGELQNAQHALDFATDLVTEWLTKFKFREWNVHSSTGLPVTPDERRQRAQEIAATLRDQKRWRTHGRSLKIHHLRAMRLLVTDYTENPDLADAIRRYYTLLQISFSTNIYKIFETPTSQIMRMEAANIPPVFGAAAPPTIPPIPKNAGAFELQLACGKCGTQINVQARFDHRAGRTPGAIQFPRDNRVKCPGPGCPEVHDLTPVRAQIERSSGRQIL